VKSTKSGKEAVHKPESCHLEEGEGRQQEEQR
jgi:hypothetical protein